MGKGEKKGRGRGREGPPLPFRKFLDPPLTDTAVDRRRLAKRCSPNFSLNSHTTVGFREIDGSVISWFACVTDHGCR